MRRPWHELTTDEAAHMRLITAGHKLDKCEFVEAIRGYKPHPFTTAALAMLTTPWESSNTSRGARTKDTVEYGDEFEGVIG